MKWETPYPDHEMVPFTKFLELKRLWDCSSGIIWSLGQGMNAGKTLKIVVKKIGSLPRPIRYES